MNATPTTVYHSPAMKKKYKMGMKDTVRTNPIQTVNASATNPGTNV